MLSALVGQLLGEGGYKVITREEDLNAILRNTIVQDSDQLRSLWLAVDKSHLHIHGDALTGFPWLFPGELKFHLLLEKGEVSAHQVEFRIVSLRITGKRTRSFHLLFYFFKYTRIIRKVILDAFTIPESPLQYTDDRKRLVFNLEFILGLVPPEMKLLGKIRIQNVAFEDGAIIWYIHSNQVLRGIIDIIGPEFIRVEPIAPDLDPLKLLTDLPLEDRKDK